MTDDDSIVLGVIVGGFLTQPQEAHLRHQLGLKYIDGFEAEDTVIGSRVLAFRADDAVTLRGVRRSASTVDIVIIGAYHGDPLIDEYRTKVEQALADLANMPA